MNRIKRIISSVVLTAFLLNTALSDYALAQNVNYRSNTDKLGTPKLTDDINGFTPQRMFVARQMLETLLSKIAGENRSIAHMSRAEIANALTKAFEDLPREAREKTRFFFHEIPDVATMPGPSNGLYRLCVRCDVAERGRETVYLTFGLNRDEAGGFPVQAFPRAEAESRYNELRRIQKEDTRNNVADKKLKPGEKPSGNPAFLLEAIASSKLANEPAIALETILPIYYAFCKTKGVEPVKRIDTLRDDLSRKSDSLVAQGYLEKPVMEKGRYVYKVMEKLRAKAALVAAEREPANSAIVNGGPNAIAAKLYNLARDVAARKLRLSLNVHTGEGSAAYVREQANVAAIETEFTRLLVKVRDKDTFKDTLDRTRDLFTIVANSAARDKGYFAPFLMQIDLWEESITSRQAAEAVAVLSGVFDQFRAMSGLPVVLKNKWPETSGSTLNEIWSSIFHSLTFEEPIFRRVERERTATAERSTGRPAFANANKDTDIKPLPVYKITKYKGAIRPGEAMRDVLSDSSPHAAVTPEAYFMYRGIFRSREDVQKAFYDNIIRYDITIMPPARWGIEAAKTYGHFHDPIEKPEIYQVISGEAWYLMQKTDSEGNAIDVIMVRARPGEFVIMLPGYGHVTINPSEDRPLIMANWLTWHQDSFYGTKAQTSEVNKRRSYKENRGAAYYAKIGRNGKLCMMPNLKYGEPVHYTQMSPADKIPEFGLIKGEPIYNLVEREDFASCVRFLNYPADYSGLLKPENTLTETPSDDIVPVEMPTDQAVLKTATDKKAAQAAAERNAESQIVPLNPAELKGVWAAFTYNFDNSGLVSVRPGNLPSIKETRFPGQSDRGEEYAFDLRLGAQADKNGVNSLNELQDRLRSKFPDITKLYLPTAESFHIALAGRYPDKKLGPLSEDLIMKTVSYLRERIIRSGTDRFMITISGLKRTTNGTIVLELTENTMLGQLRGNVSEAMRSAGWNMEKEVRANLTFGGIITLGRIIPNLEGNWVFMGEDELRRLDREISIISEELKRAPIGIEFDTVSFVHPAREFLSVGWESEIKIPLGKTDAAQITAPAADKPRFQPADLERIDNEMVQVCEARKISGFGLQLKKDYWDTLSEQSKLKICEDVANFTGKRLSDALILLCVALNIKSSYPEMRKRAMNMIADRFQELENISPEAAKQRAGALMKLIGKPAANFGGADQSLGDPESQGAAGAVAESADSYIGRALVETDLWEALKILDEAIAVYPDSDATKNILDEMRNKQTAKIRPYGFSEFEIQEKLADGAMRMGLTTEALYRYGKCLEMRPDRIDIADRLNAMKAAGASRKDLLEFIYSPHVTLEDFAKVEDRLKEICVMAREESREIFVMQEEGTIHLPILLGRMQQKGIITKSIESEESLVDLLTELISVNQGEVFKNELRELVEVSKEFNKDIAEGLKRGEMRVDTKENPRDFVNGLQDACLNNRDVVTMVPEQISAGCYSFGLLAEYYWHVASTKFTRGDFDGYMENMDKAERIFAFFSAGRDKVLMAQIELIKEKHPNAYVVTVRGSNHRFMHEPLAKNGYKVNSSITAPEALSDSYDVMNSIKIKEAMSKGTDISFSPQETEIIARRQPWKILGSIVMRSKGQFDSAAREMVSNICSRLSMDDVRQMCDEMAAATSDSDEAIMDWLKNHDKISAAEIKFIAGQSWSGGMSLYDLEQLVKKGNIKELVQPGLWMQADAIWELIVNENDPPLLVRYIEKLTQAKKAAIEKNQAANMTPQEAIDYLAGLKLPSTDDIYDSFRKTFARNPSELAEFERLLAERLPGWDIAREAALAQAAAGAAEAVSKAESGWRGKLWKKAELAAFLDKEFDAKKALSAGPIFVPRAVVPNEARMGLTPVGIKFLRDIGVKNPIYVQIGSGINRDTSETYFSDDEYRAAGAELLTWRDFAEKAQSVGPKIVVNTKDPQESEFPILKDAVLLAYLHLAAHPALARNLCDVIAGGVAYETISYDDNGILRTPVLAPASHAAGWLSAVRYAETVLAKKAGLDLRSPAAQGQMEKWFREDVESYPGMPRRLAEALYRKTVVVLGGGEVGASAAFAAADMGADVYITEINVNRILELEQMIAERRARSAAGSIEVVIRNQQMHPAIDKDEIRENLWRADAIIGAYYVEGAKPSVEIGHTLYQLLKKRGQLEYVADPPIDQGGSIAIRPGAEVSVERAYGDGWVMEDGVSQFTVRNMPSAVPLQVSLDLERAKTPYLVSLLMGSAKAITAFPELAGGFNIYNGKVTHPNVARDIGKEYVPLEKVLSDAGAEAGPDMQKIRRLADFGNRGRVFMGDEQRNVGMQQPSLYRGTTSQAAAMEEKGQGSRVKGQGAEPAQAAPARRSSTESASTSEGGAAEMASETIMLLEAADINISLIHELMPLINPTKPVTVAEMIQLLRDRRIVQSESGRELLFTGVSEMPLNGNMIEAIRRILESESMLKEEVPGKPAAPEMASERDMPATGGDLSWSGGMSLYDLEQLVKNGNTAELVQPGLHRQADYIRDLIAKHYPGILEVYERRLAEAQAVVAGKLAYIAEIFESSTPQQQLNLIDKTAELMRNEPQAIYLLAEIALRAASTGIRDHARKAFDEASLRVGTNGYIHWAVLKTVGGSHDFNDIRKIFIGGTDPRIQEILSELYVKDAVRQVAAIRRLGEMVSKHPAAVYLLLELTSDGASYRINAEAVKVLAKARINSPLIMEVLDAIHMQQLQFSRCESDNEKLWSAVSTAKSRLKKVKEASLRDVFRETRFKGQYDLGKDIDIAVTVIAFSRLALGSNVSPTCFGFLMDFPDLEQFREAYKAAPEARQSFTLADYGNVYEYLKREEEKWWPYEKLLKEGYSKSRAEEALYGEIDSLVYRGILEKTPAAEKPVKFRLTPKGVKLIYAIRVMRIYIDNARNAVYGSQKDWPKAAVDARNKLWDDLQQLKMLDGPALVREIVSRGTEWSGISNMLSIHKREMPENSYTYVLEENIRLAESQAKSVYGLINQNIGKSREVPQTSAQAAAEAKPAKPMPAAGSEQSWSGGMSLYDLEQLVKNGNIAELVQPGLWLQSDAIHELIVNEHDPALLVRYTERLAQVKKAAIEKNQAANMTPQEAIDYLAGLKLPSTDDIYDSFRRTFARNPSELAEFERLLAAAEKTWSAEQRQPVSQEAYDWNDAEKVLSYPATALGKLNNRIKIAFIRLDIKTIEDLLKQDPKSFLILNDFKETDLEELRLAVAERGLALKDENLGLMLGQKLAELYHMKIPEGVDVSRKDNEVRRTIYNALVRGLSDNSLSELRSGNSQRDGVIFMIHSGDDARPIFYINIGKIRDGSTFHMMRIDSAGMGTEGITFSSLAIQDAKVYQVNEARLRVLLFDAETAVSGKRAQVSAVAKKVADTASSDDISVLPPLDPWEADFGVRQSGFDDYPESVEMKKAPAQAATEEPTFSPAGITPEETADIADYAEQAAEEPAMPLPTAVGSAVDSAIVASKRGLEAESVVEPGIDEFAVRKPWQMSEEVEEKAPESLGEIDSSSETLQVPANPEEITTLGRMIADESQGRYNLLLPMEFFAGKLAEHQERFGSRFKLDGVSGLTKAAASPDEAGREYVDKLLEKIRAGEESLTIAIVPSGLAASQVERLKSIKGIRVIAMDLGLLQSMSDPAGMKDKESFQVNTYAMMYAMRNVKGAGDETLLRKILDYFISGHLDLVEGMTLKSYIEALVNNDVERMIKACLKPAMPVNAKKEHDNLSYPLIFA